MDEIVLREDLARTAYEVYAHQRRWKTYVGDPMSGFDDLPEGIQEAWAYAVHAVEFIVKSEIS